MEHRQFQGRSKTARNIKLFNFQFFWHFPPFYSTVANRILNLKLSRDQLNCHVINWPVQQLKIEAKLWYLLFNKNVICLQQMSHLNSVRKKGSRDLGETIRRVTWLVIYVYSRIFKNICSGVLDKLCVVAMPQRSQVALSDLVLAAVSGNHVYHAAIYCFHALVKKHVEKILIQRIWLLSQSQSSSIWSPNLTKWKFHPHQQSNTV